MMGRRPLSTMNQITRETTRFMQYQLRNNEDLISVTLLNNNKFVEVFQSQVWKTYLF